MPALGIITLPVPVVIRLKLPVTAGSLLRVKSALVVVKLALPDVLAEVSVNALVSVNAKLPPPVKDRVKLVNVVFHTMAVAALLKLIFALAAAKVIVWSASNKSRALMVKLPVSFIPVMGIITLPVPVALSVKLPAMDGSALKVKFALVAVKLALAPVVAEVSVNALLSVKAKSPAPVNDKIKLLKSVAQLRVVAALRKVMLALVAVKFTSRSVSNKSLAFMVNAAG